MESLIGIYYWTLLSQQRAFMFPKKNQKENWNFLVLTLQSYHCLHLRCNFNLKVALFTLGISQGTHVP